MKLKTSPTTALNLQILTEVAQETLRDKILRSVLAEYYNSCQEIRTAGVIVHLDVRVNFTGEYVRATLAFDPLSLGFNLKVSESESIDIQAFAAEKGLTSVLALSDSWAVGYNERSHSRIKDGNVLRAGAVREVHTFDNPCNRTESMTIEIVAMTSGLTQQEDHVVSKLACGLAIARVIPMLQESTDMQRRKEGFFYI